MHAIYIICGENCIKINSSHYILIFIILIYPIIVISWIQFVLLHSLILEEKSDARWRFHGKYLQDRDTNVGFSHVQHRCGFFRWNLFWDGSDGYIHHHHGSRYNKHQDRNLRRFDA